MCLRVVLLKKIEFNFHETTEIILDNDHQNMIDNRDRYIVKPSLNYVWTFFSYCTRTVCFRKSVVRSHNGLPEPSGVQDGGRGPGLLLRVQQGQEGETGGLGSRDHRPRQGEHIEKHAIE